MGKGRREEKVGVLGKREGREGGGNTVVSSSLYPQWKVAEVRDARVSMMRRLRFILYNL